MVPPYVTGRTGLLACSLAIVLAAGAVLWNARQEIAGSRESVRRESEIAHSLRTLTGAPIPEAGLIASRASLVDAAYFQDKLWLLASGALMRVGGDGRVEATWRSGIELPPAALTRMAAGVAGGSKEQALFIGTSGAGVLIHDGQSMRQLWMEPAEARKVPALLPLSSGQLLIGTEKHGVLSWDGSAVRWFHDSLKSSQVTALAGGVDSLWIGTLDQGALHLHAGRLDQHRGELPDPRVLSLAVEGESAYVGTALGVAEFAGGQFARGIGDGLFAKALLREGASLLVGTLEEGLVEVPLASRRPRPNTNRGLITEGAVASLVRTGDRALAVLPDRVLLRDGQTWTPIDTAQEALLSDSNVAALALGDGGQVWIGYFDRGLDILDTASLRVTHIEDEHIFCVNRIVPRPDGAVVATANGLVTLDRAGKTRRILTREQGLIATHVTDVLVDDDQMVAATPAGLTFLTAGLPRSIYAFHGLVNNHVYALAASGGRLIAGTLGGVSIVEAGVVKANYTTANSALRHNWISAAVTAGSDVYAGTYGAGVYRFDGVAWQPSSGSREPFEVNPNAMAATEDAVFAGTLNRGLAVHNRRNGRWAFHASGLPSLNVTAVAVGSGAVYVGTDNGLVRFAERSLPLP